MPKPDKLPVKPEKGHPDEQQVHLRFKQGASDKVYNIHLQKHGNGWMVNFAYGRWNKPLRTGTKTTRPLPYEEAKAAFDSLVQEKTSKGYSGENSGTPFAHVQAGEKTNWLPQLLNPIDESDAAEILREWLPYMMVQIKHDGERRGVLMRSEVIPANRKGLRTTVHPSIQQQLEELLPHIQFDCVLDCEDMGDHLVIFDVIRDGTPETFDDRAEGLYWLSNKIDRLALHHLRVDIPIRVNTWPLLETIFQQARAKGEEGVVLRHAHSFYTPGRPNSGGEALKVKFYESATCFVESVHPTKRSIGLGLFEGEERIFMGNCTIPPNYPIPRIDDLVEIKYLYANRGGALYQPQYKGVRTDLDSAEAQLSQLKFKD